ncbi:protein FAM237A [Sphaerodactylus townsendi]|uniref:protein FAM237A n=1 Tax=Sphaerodactylus townsendi TaxID=933632 RepID=UPI002026A28D|nr:protein FAM237A [Sphaerodactylus townsendi]
MDSGISKKAPSNMRFTGSLFMMGVLCVMPFFCHSQLDPLALGRADPQCWESSSLTLLEMRKPPISDSVGGFWDFMLFLKSSDNLKHGVLFWDLAQLFWDIYVECVLSRTHGLGKRQLDEGRPQIAALPSWITRRILSQIQVIPVVEKKELNKDLINIQVLRSESAFLRRITGQIRMKKK